MRATRSWRIPWISRFSPASPFATRRRSSAAGLRRRCFSHTHIVSVPKMIPGGLMTLQCRCVRAVVLAAASLSLAAQSGNITVDVTPGHVINSFDPDGALGSSIDVLSKSGIDKVYSPHILQESLSAGWGPITFRNNTELRMAAWHWTENGAWSDPVHKSGYFTGSAELKEPLRYILSYSLPHRGFATSGDRPGEGPHLSYWKSNPYLAGKFTGESDALHPQWVVLDMRAAQPVSAGGIAWKSAYAKTCQVDYWVGGDALDFDDGPKGEWKTFAKGQVNNAQGGTVVLKLADAPVSTRLVRLLHRSLARGHRCQYRRRRPAQRLRHLLHQRLDQQSAGHDPGDPAVWHAGRCRRPDRLHRKARLPHR